MTLALSPFWTGFSLVIGLFFIWFSGYWAGRLWERGTQVRRVMTGSEPPPWDDEPVFLPRDWTGHGIDVLDDSPPEGSSFRQHLDAPIPTRSDVYDQDRDGFA